MNSGEEEQFSYTHQEEVDEQNEEEDENEFVYEPTVSHEPEPEQHEPQQPSTRTSIAGRVELEKIYGAATSGDLDLLQRLFRSAIEEGDLDSFSLANEPSPRSGLTLLHSAANKGHLDIVRWCRSLDPIFVLHLT